MTKKAVVFSANLSYMEKLEIAIKSLCAGSMEDLCVE